MSDIFNIYMRTNSNS